ncbi:dual specificity protein kinase Ttk [Diabrotica virgifera virgifera]|uniref:Dual specificity protein kinase Ttk n=1 Tax=Diabrotica virgifera virgifera TaxID=50390 RepID=A0A6P7F3U7_DIAVI|nr:dual specificity protein kinase Ttk [Diabrotica virgifera virgifera]
MNSTSDFSELRKNIVQNDLFLRRTQSAAKKKPNIPKKIIPLVPLNFDELKREIAEAEELEKLDKLNSRTEESKQHERSSTNDNIFHRHKKPDKIGPRLDSSDGFKTLEKIKEAETEENLQHRKENVEPEQPIKIISATKDNDSFDLDFSALSLHTPMKKQMIPETPNTRIGKRNQLVPTFNNFTTPTVKSIPSKIHCSVSGSATLASASKKFINKPEKALNSVNNVICSIPRSVPNDQTFNRILVNNVEYLILNLLGKGGSSVVYQCFCIDRKLLVAIKCVNLDDTVTAQGFINEVQLLQRLHSCDRIIRLYDYQISEAEKKLYMVLEKGGEEFSTVLKNLGSNKANIPLYMLLFYWMEMLQAVSQIHSHGVIHSDLKPSNFLWGDKGLKLIDFGISSSVQSDMTSVFKTLAAGSCNYMSPEALSNDGGSSPGKTRYKLHYKSDVWSLGCILYELVYKAPPFHHIKQLWTKLAFIMDPKHQIQYPEANWVPPKIIQTIKKCLQYNVKSRPSVNELLDEYDKELCNM